MDDFILHFQKRGYSDREIFNLLVKSGHPAEEVRRSIEYLRDEKALKEFETEKTPKNTETLPAQTIIVMLGMILSGIVAICAILWMLLGGKMF